MCGSSWCPFTLVWTKSPTKNPIIESVLHDFSLSHHISFDIPFLLFVVFFKVIHVYSDKNFWKIQAHYHGTTNKRIEPYMSGRSCPWWGTRDPWIFLSQTNTHAYGGQRQLRKWWSYWWTPIKDWPHAPSQEYYRTKLFTIFFCNRYKNSIFTIQHKKILWIIFVAYTITILQGVYITTHFTLAHSLHWLDQKSLSLSFQKLMKTSFCTTIWTGLWINTALLHILSLHHTHSNRLTVVGAAKRHPLLTNDNIAVKKVDFNVQQNVTDTKVVGKRKNKLFCLFGFFGVFFVMRWWCCCFVAVFVAVLYVIWEGWLFLFFSHKFLFLPLLSLSLCLSQYYKVEYSINLRILFVKSPVLTTQNILSNGISTWKHGKTYPQWPMEIIFYSYII